MGYEEYQATQVDKLPSAFEKGPRYLEHNQMAKFKTQRRKSSPSPLIGETEPEESGTRPRLHEGNDPAGKRSDLLTLFQGFIFHFTDNRCLLNVYYYGPNPELSVLLPCTLFKSQIPHTFGGIWF